MASVWQRFTLSDLPDPVWLQTSHLYGLIGSLQLWRRGSWLMPWADTIGLLLLSLVFGLAPFVSNALIGLLLVACAGFWLIITLSDGEAGNLTRKPIHLLVLLYWGIATLATALSPVRKAALVGWGKLTLYLLLFALMAQILRSARLRSWLIGLYLHIALIVSAYGIRQWFDQVEPLATWNDPSLPAANVTRVYSYLGNPNLLGGYLLPAIAFSLAALLTWRRWGPKALALTMLIVNCYCLRYTDSRGAWIGFVILIFVFLVLLWLSQLNHLPPFWQTWALPIGLGALVVLLALAIVAIEPIRNRVFSIFFGRGDSSSNYRLNVWSAVIEMIKKRPILGIGPGNTAFNQIYPLFQRPRYSALSAYSILLEVSVETGFIGLSCFLWFLTVTFNQGVKHLGELQTRANPQGFWLIGAMAAMAGMLGHGLVDTVWYRPEISMLWWLSVAVIASYGPFNSPSSVSEKSAKGAE
ncbi:putative bicarbonate transporter, IctB family [Leptolyngbya sp. 'hensonii']|uniref:IctB family putative bicarbonate transporter n=1 Tax=Leptolyngbya sp. 'hensonii' TaxID=1922337 RepID=UPI00095004D5|nr:IctB family putative bicarbonate transporter [Leptolyngbya sp. 'hensonii']OLP19467.1 putative bicarbonate transporter, IctB family [Leptolyngbya sp. 'hensonii']